MKYCKKCGKELEDDAIYCHECGEQQEATQNENYHEQQNNYYQNSNPNDKPSLFFAIVSFMIPMVGFILYAIWLKDFPNKAKSCLNGAIVCLCLYAFCFICGLCGPLMFI